MGEGGKRGVTAQDADYEAETEPGGAVVAVYEDGDDRANEQASGGVDRERGPGEEAKLRRSISRSRP